MNITIRTADPQTDYEGAAAIISLYEPEPITAERMRELDARNINELMRHIVAVDDAGRIVGYGEARHSPWLKKDDAFVQAMVDPACCNQGIGTMIHNSNLAFARENGVTSVVTWVSEDRPAAVRFAEKRGFTVDHHIFSSIIDLKTYDESPFAGVIEAVQASGIRLFSLADAGNTVDALRKMWEVNHRTQLDDPGSGGESPNFEEYQKITTEKWFRSDGQLLAADGDTYIGLASVSYFKEGNSAYNVMTGILPDYRGRKIALALKLLSIRAAKSWGVDTIRTHNDAQNAPMLAINRKLGYVAEPGLYRMTKTLDANH